MNLKKQITLTILLMPFIILSSCTIDITKPDDDAKNAFISSYIVNNVYFEFLDSGEKYSKEDVSSCEKSTCNINIGNIPIPFGT